MDSGNSGSLSLQSSSGGGDDEFDSRCGENSSPLSALLRQPPAPSSSVLPSFGDPSFYGVHDLAAPLVPHWSSTTPLPTSTAPQTSGGHGAPQASADHAAPAQQAVSAPARASRKRTRASRRAPTTVLTTDTSNFRAMVQEFTGVPSPPVAGAACARSSRSLDHLFPSLLRPFAHKLQQAAPFPPPAYIAASSASKAISSSASPRTTAVASSDGYQLVSGVLGMQDHSSYLSFHQSPVGATMFDAAGPSPAHQRLPDPAGFMGLAHGQMNSRHRDHSGDELSGLLGVTGACNKAAYSSGASRAGPPRLDRNAQSTTTTTTIAAGAATTTTAAMRAQGADSSWICTSE